MEDFSTILWVVIIVAAMIFNSASKARKARNNGQPSPQHGEAWPSIPWDNPQDEPQKPAAPTPQTAHPKIPVPKPIPVPPPISHNERIPIPKMPREWAERALERDGIPGKREKQERPSARPAAFGRGNGDSARSINSEPPVFTEFPDECQSLEVIPAEEYQPEYATPETAAFKNLPGKKTKKTQAAGQQHGAVQTTQNPGNGDSKQDASEWAEEFDLRRAVIYSEILKPKFEE